MQAWFEKTEKMFDAAFISGDRWKLYLSGLGVTLEVAFFAAILGMIIGTILAFMKLSVRRNGKKTIFQGIHKRRPIPLYRRRHGLIFHEIQLLQRLPDLVNV